MAEVTINTNNRTNYPLTDDFPGAIVWTKPTWADDWTRRDDIYPLDCSWTTGKTLPTATLHYRYGSVLVPGELTLQTLTPITTRGYYVLIAFGTHDGNPLYWLGYAETAITSNHIPARDSLPASGIQTIPCFGMLRALTETWIVTTVHEDPAGGTDPKRAFGGSIFNRNNRGNRSIEKRKIDDGIEAYVFENPDEDGEWWNSQDIIEHLFAFHVPTPNSVVLVDGLPWSLGSLANVPDWDRPTIATDSRSVVDILAELLSSDRLLNFAVAVESTFVDVDEPPTIDGLAIVPFTTTPTAITLPAFGNVAANTDTIILQCLNDPQTMVKVTEDESEVVDQLIVRGPREIGVGTFTYTDFTDDWAAGDETKYELGASLASDWDSLTLSEKRERNDTARNSPDLKKVYRVWRLKKDWDGQVDDGAAGRTELFPQAGDPLEVYVPYLAGIEFLDRLPLYSGVDYEGQVADVDEADSRTMIQPLFAMENPDTTSLEDFRRLGSLSVGFHARQANKIPISLAGSVDNEFGPRIIIDVSGGPQHAIKYGFTTTDSDPPQERWGEWDYETLVATLAVRGDRRPYYELPASDATEITGLDTVRRKIITIEHSTLELVHLAAGCIVKFDEDGEPVYSEGGVLRDPTDMIQAVATMLAEYYTKPRKRCVITTGWRLSQMAVGSILKTSDTWSSAINAQIIEITVRNPLQDADRSQPPTMEIIAASQRFDPMSLIIPTDPLSERQ